MGQCCCCANASESYVDFLWTVRFLGESSVDLPPLGNIKNVVSHQRPYMSGHGCPQSLLHNLCDRTKAVTGGQCLHYWLVACPCVPCKSSSSACYPRQFINSSPSMLWKQSSWDDKYYDHPSFERHLTSLIPRARAPHQGQCTYRTQRASWAGAASCCMWPKSCMQKKCSANTAGKRMEGQELVCSFVSLFLEINLGRILDGNLRGWEAFTGKSSLEFRMIGRTILSG